MSLTAGHRLELVEGSTLDARIAQGAIEIKDALSIAKQLAEGLEAAHERGIIHRDLKPANIKVRPDGSVKILDFGLARVAQADAAIVSSSASLSPTLTSPAYTQLGMIIGTAAYMAPEQASGKAVDKRVDIWAFGVVFWEMLAGRRLFEGETVSHTLADVLRAPIDLEALPQTTPRAIRLLLTRCLDRDVTTRLRDVGEARVAIQQCLANPIEDQGSAVLANQRRASRWRGSTVWTLLGIAGVALATVGVLGFRDRPRTLRALHASLMAPDGADFDFNSSQALPALSPDGSQIVFGARAKNGAMQLYVRRLDSLTVFPLPGTEDATFPFWSPDNRWVGFGQANRLKKIDVQGGPPVTLVSDLGGDVRGGTWNRDGVIVFGTNRSRSLLRVSAGGGTTSALFELDSVDRGVPVQPVYPYFLPDGHRFIYTTRQTGEIPVRVASIDKPGDPGQVVAHAHSNAMYADGYLLYLRESTLMGQLFDERRLVTNGEAVPLAQGIPTYITPSRGAPVTVSTTGRMVYQSGGGGYRWRVSSRDRKGGRGVLAEGEEQFIFPAISPDGMRLAVSRRAQTADIWVYDLRRRTSTRLTFTPSANQPTWSQDGDVIFYSAAANDHFELFQKRATGASPEQLVAASSQSKQAPALSPDGKWLLFTGTSNASDRKQLWLLPLTTDGHAQSPARRFIESRGNDDEAQFSPDGRWVAYGSDESGTTEAYITPFPGPGGKLQVSSGGARSVSWRRDGKELYYVTNTGQLNAVEILNAKGTLSTGRIETVLDGLIGAQSGQYAASSDGDTFFVIENAAEGVGRPLTIVENWTALLKK